MLRWPKREADEGPSELRGDRTDEAYNAWKPKVASSEWDNAERRWVPTYHCDMCRDTYHVSVPQSPSAIATDWCSPQEAYEQGLDLMLPHVLRYCPACKPAEAHYRVGSVGKVRLTEHEYGWLLHWAGGRKSHLEALRAEQEAAGGRQAWRDAQFAKIRGWMAEMDAKSGALKRQVRVAEQEAG